VLFQLRLKQRVELRQRTLELWGFQPGLLVLQKGEIVDVLDVDGPRFLCDTRHGRVMLPHEVLKPLAKRPPVAHPSEG
jgi:hypothetical protein